MLNAPSVFPSPRGRGCKQSLCNCYIIPENCLLLLVAHTVRDEHNQEVIRIISARKATAQERKNYEKNYSL
ncbi:hypothetical protein BMT54_02070 [Pasteurellaceae bacterium 15-036681]|nr:hypothetical protein BMT54_02070 [Pasteurellaceae bacterium 15-036681]